MLRQKNAELHSIADVVCSNTGMTKEALLHDTHTYRIDGLETALIISMLVEDDTNEFMHPGETPQGIRKFTLGGE